MILPRDILSQSLTALRAHRLRTALTTLGLTLGVSTLIGVMTLVQGANRYVEEKVATLGTDVFQVARTPFTLTDFDLIIKALRFKKIYSEDFQAVAALCQQCGEVGATATVSIRARRGDQELSDVNLIGHSANMADIDSRTVEAGRYFSSVEDARSTQVCLIGAGLADQLFTGSEPIGQRLRAGNDEYTIIGRFERLGSVLGQNQDNFVVIPLNTWLKTRDPRMSLTLNVRVRDERLFEQAQDEVRQILRGRRHVPPKAEDDFFIGTRASYIALWNSISGAFFAVFVMVSSISAVVGGIVIMNVMLVSVTERTKEIGVRRALGASQADIYRQFLTESVLQCLVGGSVGVGLGFLGAVALRNFTSFPANVQAWVAILGVLLSSVIGVFFGLYPAGRAARLDPVNALRSE